MLGKIEGRGERDDRRRDGWVASRLNRHEFVQEMVKHREAWYATVHGVAKGQI